MQYLSYILPNSSSSEYARSACSSISSPASSTLADTLTPISLSITFIITNVPKNPITPATPTPIAWMSSCCGCPNKSPFGPLGFTSVLANIPIPSEPIIPATPCTELTSNASSILRCSLKNKTARYDPIPIAIPSTNACSTLMYPDAGVMPTSPAIAPLIAAITLGLPVRIHDNPTQINAEIDDAMCVLMIVFPAKLPDASALPALNPNHPSHNNDEPKTAIGIL